MRTQGWDTVGVSAKTSDLWAPGDNKDTMPRGSSSDMDESDDYPKDVLTQRGFMNMVKLIEELQFEKELEQEKGVGLVPGPVFVV